MKWLVAVASLGLLASTAHAGPRVDANGALIRGADSCGTTRTPIAVATPEAKIAPANPSAARTIYLNRNGGTYNITNSATNAATNTANTIAAGDGRIHMGAVIPPLEPSFDWPYIVACVKKQYKPYNVTITETEPTSGTYVEAVVGGSGATTGWSASSGILGVAAADSFCRVTENGIAFSFSTNHIGIAKANDELCATVAHEIGHLLSLEHEISGPDTMSYVPFASVNQKSFTSANSQCGTTSQDTTTCSCPTTGAGQVTNSGMRLTQYLGLRPTETVPPSLELTSPGDDSKLRPSFSVVATASDETAMDGLTVLVDGVMVAASTTPQGTTYTIPVADVAEGAHTLEVQAVDLAGNVTKKQVAITVARGALGETCSANADCSGALCAVADGASFCTQTCGAEAACPSDFECQSAGTQSVCVPSSGGCSTGGASGFLTLLLAAPLFRRRRSSGAANRHVTPTRQSRG